MNPTERLYDIVRQGLCIGCGACQAIAGRENLRMRQSDSGCLFPEVIGTLDGSTVEQIYDVCPGTRVEGLPAEEHSEEGVVDPVWGPYHHMVMAWATDPVVRFEGSTGGMLTALARFLLDDDRVEFILHTRAARDEPAFGEAHLSFTPADVMAGAGSRYGPTATLVDVDRALARERPFAFIGKPCDIAALRNYGRHDARVAEYVRYWLTPVCGGYAPYSFTRRFMQERHIDPDMLTALRYRGRGCPGPTRFETLENAREYHYLDFWGEDESQWSLPPRCKVCADGIGEAADIAAADAWPGGSPDRVSSLDDPGSNAIIVRTDAGRDLLAAAVSAGAVTLGEPVSVAQMNDFQPHQVAKKQAVWARHQGMGEEGRIVPQTHRLRIRELAADQSSEHLDAQRQGMRERIRAGKASESWPPARTDQEQ